MENQTTTLAPPLLGIELNLRALDQFTGAEEITAIGNDENAEWFLEGLAKFAAAEGALKCILAELAETRKKYIERFEPSLREYVAKRLELAGGDGKTVKFDHGACSFRTVPGGLTIADPRAALEHAKAEGWKGVIKIVPAKEDLDTTAYRELAQLEMNDTGELIPGVEMRPTREDFTVKPTITELTK